MTSLCTEFADTAVTYFYGGDFLSSPRDFFSLSPACFHDVRRRLRARQPSLELSWEWDLAAVKAQLLQGWAFLSIPSICLV